MLAPQALREAIRRQAERLVAILAPARKLAGKGPGLLRRRGSAGIPAHKPPARAPARAVAGVRDVAARGGRGRTR
jgi:hypothetical protein